MNIISPINQLGYGIAGLNIVKSLSNKVDVSLFPLGSIEVTNENDQNILKTAIMNSRFFKYEDPCIRIWHQHDMSQFVGRGTKIGFPFFELDTFNEMEKHHLNSVDKLFVCSSWAKGVCVNNGINVPISIVPLGVDTELFKPAINTRKDDKTIFFNCGKWEIRKGHDVLVEIFNRAFGSNDNVELWMMCSNPFLSPEEEKSWKNIYKQSNLGNKIKMIPRLKSQEEVYNIMENIDCGIFPSRAEGWNLELLELLSCGKMAIASNVSAHTEFCNSKAVYLIDMPEKELAEDGKWFFKQGSWAKITESTMNDFVEAMRTAYKRHQQNKNAINKDGIEVANNFTWSNTAEKILTNV
jgi:glycosyltransferase involved in cell wall biosynthesis